MPDVIAVRPSTRTMVAVAVFAAVAAASLAPVWGHLDQGWPFSHEGPAFAQRTLIYARHLTAFDPLPIWSSADNDGFGSPMPLMYHKLFYLLAAPLFLVTRSMNAALLMALFALLVAGALGMERLMRALGASRLAAIVAGSALIVANYTVTNWMVRGNVAECSAAMMVPWVFLGFVRSLEAKRLAPSLGLSLGLLWLGHSVLAFYAAVLLAVTFVLLAVSGNTSWSVLHPRFAWRPVAIFAAILLPYIVPMLIAGGDYDFSRILTPPFRPEDQFRPWSWYVWDTHWRFGKTVSGLTRQLDLPMLALSIVGVAACIWRTKLARTSDRPVEIRPLLPLALVLCLASALQMSWSAPAYHWIPGALFIQFPWRLLALMTPALIACGLLLADRGLAGDLRTFCLGAAAAWMIAGSGAFVPIEDPRLPLDRPTLTGVSFSGFREYEPAAAPPRPQTLAAVKDRWRAIDCDVDRIDPSDEERREGRWRMRCARGAVVALPVYASPLHRVANSRFDRSQGCLVVSELPTLCGVTVPAGESTVTVRFPALSATVPWMWRTVLRDQR